jgi:hypothetical protein
LQFVAILLAPTSKQDGRRKRSRRTNLASEILVPSSVSPSSYLVLSDVATVEVAGGLPQPTLVEVARDLPQPTLVEVAGIAEVTK